MELFHRGRTGYSPDAADEHFRAGALKYSAVCILAVIIAVIAADVFIIHSDSAFSRSWDIFQSYDKTCPEFSDMSDGLAGSGVKIRAESCGFSAGTVTLEIYGENHSGKDWTATGKTFMLSSFNSRAAQTRSHYYSDNWQELTVPDGEAFRISLTFSVQESETGPEDGYIFTLSAFSDGEFPALEILLDN